MTRQKAAFNHLILSLFIFVSIVFSLIIFWYPEPHFSVSGGWQGLKIAASIDLVLGPLLTLIIFNQGKSKNKLIGDLIVIAIIQFSALVYGVNTIYQQRPVAVVFWDDGFYSVPASAFKDNEFNSREWQGTLQQGLPFIYAEKPATEGGLSQLLELIEQNGLPPHHQVALYRPFKPYIGVLRQHQVNITEVIKANKTMKLDFDDFLSRTDTKLTEHLYFPLFSKYQNNILIFDQSGRLEGFITVPLREQ